MTDTIVLANGHEFSVQLGTIREANTGSWEHGYFMAGLTVKLDMGGTQSFYPVCSFFEKPRGADSILATIAQTLDTDRWPEIVGKRVMALYRLGDSSPLTGSRIIGVANIDGSRWYLKPA